MISEIVPSALAGERLDRIVSFVADISRSNAAATIAAAGVRVDGVPAVERQDPSRRGSAGRGRRVDDPAGAAARRRSVGRVRRRVRGRGGGRGRQAGGARRASRRRQHGGHAGAWPAGALSRHRRRRRTDAAGHRPPPRRRELRAARGRPHARVVGGADRPVRVTHGEPSVRGARVGSSRRRARHRRRADRTRSARPAPHGRRR